MTSKREKLQYAYVFFADLLTMAVSVLLAWLITDGLFGVLIPYTSTDWLLSLIHILYQEAHARLHRQGDLHGVAVPPGRARGSDRGHGREQDVYKRQSQIL